MAFYHDFSAGKQALCPFARAPLFSLDGLPFM
jgi:hypothetical protein